MSTFKKHTDVVATMEEFSYNYRTGKYASPWLVYVGNDVDGYSVVYSNDEERDLSRMPENFITSIQGRLEALETEKVFCYEHEYNELIENGRAWVTKLDGTREEVDFDQNKMYCIYEEEGPTNETPAE